METHAPRKLGAASRHPILHSWNTHVAIKQASGSEKAVCADTPSFPAVSMAYQSGSQNDAIKRELSLCNLPFLGGDLRPAKPRSIYLSTMEATTHPIIRDCPGVADPDGIGT